MAPLSTLKSGNMKTVGELLSDAEISKAWANANFGDVGRRELIANTLLKCASGFVTGSTAKAIVSELGLTTTKWTLTVKGKQYLWAAYSGGKSL